MKRVKRYDVTGFSENKNGNWVSYDDYEMHVNVVKELWLESLKRERHYRTRVLYAGGVVFFHWFMFVVFMVLYVH